MSLKVLSEDVVLEIITIADEAHKTAEKPPKTKDLFKPRPPQAPSVAAQALLLLIEGLSTEECQELAALMWLGRGELLGGYTDKNWARFMALSESTSPAYIAAKTNMLASYLRVGLRKMHEGLAKKQ